MCVCVCERERRRQILIDCLYGDEKISDITVFDGGIVMHTQVYSAEGRLQECKTGNKAELLMAQLELIEKRHLRHMLDP